MVNVVLFVHIFLFVLSFAFTAGISILCDRVAASSDSHVIQMVFRAARPLSITGGIGWVLTALTGAALVSMSGSDMTAPWLLWSYAAFAVLILTGFLMHSPWQARVIAAAPGAELDAVLKAPIHRVAVVLSSLSILALILLMTLRPSL